MSKVLSFQVEVPDTVSEQNFRAVEVIARQTVIMALQQRGELSVREAAAILGLTYEQYLQFLNTRGLGVSQFEQDSTVLQSLRQRLSNNNAAQP